MYKPEKSIQAPLKSISTFSALSGYKINLGKSVATPFNIPHDMAMQLPFQVSRRGFKYLGILVTPNLNSLFESNYSPLIQKIRNDLTKWAYLPAPLLGRINTVKMNVLPRLDDLFQNLLCYLTPTLFKSHYIWNNKHPGVKFSMLTKPKDLGGLSLPVLQFYYWSAQLKMMLNWFMKRNVSLWLGLESQSCSPRTLSSLPFINNIDQLNYLKNNLLLYNF